MKTVDQVIARFRRHYNGCDATTALDLFQTAYKRLLDKAEFRTSDIAFSAIVAGTREYAWPEADLRCYGVTWYDSPISFRQLRPTSEDELRAKDPDWKDGKQLGTAIAVLSDTAATPTVLQTATAHGFLAANDGTLTNQVYVHGLGGIADGYYFAKVGVNDATHFALYSDIAATVGVAGNAVVSSATIQPVVSSWGSPCAFYLSASKSGNSAALVLGFDLAPSVTTLNGYPMAIAHCEEHIAISGGTVIPYSVLDEMYFVYAMCEFWAYENDVQKATLWERKRIQEESVQIAHLKGLIPIQETQILPPFGSAFSTRIQ